MTEIEKPSDASNERIGDKLNVMAQGSLRDDERGKWVAEAALHAALAVWRK